MGIVLLIVVLGYLGYEIYRRMNQPATSGYSKTNSGDWTEFKVTPGRETIRVAMILPGVGCALLAAFFPEPYNIFFVALTAIAVWFTFLPVRRKAHRTAVSFRADPTTIESQGQKFPVADIHRLTIKNSVDTDFVIAATNERAAVVQAQHAQDKLRAAKMAFYLNLEEGGRDHPLAGGLSETTANGLMTDVGSIIGFGD